jgi:hypothetical protein
MEDPESVFTVPLFIPETAGGFAGVGAVVSARALAPKKTQIGPRSIKTFLMDFPFLMILPEASNHF